MTAMSDVKWIKITTDIFDDEKILLIESLPEADSIIVIWFKLLCFAGKINNSGVFMLNDKMAYTDKMLATIFRRKESTVKLALQTFEEFGMIEIVDDVITIPNWGKHQNLETIEKRKDYMRDYMQEYRTKQKEIACKPNSKPNSKPNVNCAEIEEEKEEEREIEKEKENREKKPAPASKKHSFGDYKNVKLTDEEFKKLVADYGSTETDKAIQFLDEYVEMKGVKYKSHYLVMKKWVFDAVKEKEQRSRKAAAGSTNRAAEDLEAFYKMASDWAEREDGK